VNEQHSNLPLVIGGLGGSGTRVATRVISHTGRFMGAGLPESEDAQEMDGFALKWAVPYMEARLRESPLPDAAAMVSEFEEGLRRHIAPIAGSATPWGFKNPQNIHFLPFLVEQLGDFRFIHVIRDGRDMAFGGFPRPRIIDAYVGPVMAGEPDPLRMISYWDKANRLAADVGRSELGSNYHLVRLEDLCFRTESTVRGVLEFGGHASGELVEAAVADISTPDTLGRWQSQNGPLLEEVTAAGGAALKQFGYLDEPRQKSGPAT
jgi:hypothetical protein